MTAKKSNRKEVKIKPKGYDFPKIKIPKRLKKTEEQKRDKEGASIFDYIKHYATKVFDTVKNTVQTVKDVALTIPEIIGKAFNTIPSIREVKTVAYLLLAIFVLFGLFKILGWI